MHCPKCGQHQVSDDTRFCSRCGLPLSGIAMVVQHNGLVPVVQTKKTFSTNTPRRKGLKQGLFIFLLSFLIVPITVILTIAANGEPFGVVIAAILFGVGGMLRMAYALLFQSDDVTATPEFGMGPSIAEGENLHSLPSSSRQAAADYVSPIGTWRDTNDLKSGPPSVTDKTTRLLEHDDRQ